MLKKLLLVFLLLFTSYLLPFSVHAENEFASDVSVYYQVEESGKTIVTHTITLQNLFSNLYATSYTLSLDNIEPQNVSVTEQGKALGFNQKKDGTQTQITVDFTEALVGKDKLRTFKITFEESSFAVRSGEVWEISIPRLSSEENFRSYKASLSVPSSFGLEAYISPTPAEEKITDGLQIYYFDKESIAKTGVTAGFGAFQTFSFTLNYHLENPLNKSANVDIAIPPDTALQRIYYQVINPRPKNVYLDGDGNWLATYNLKPRERIDVETKGVVQIFAGPRPFLQPTRETLNENLKESPVWQSNNSQIKQLGQTLATPKAIYDYVWQNLTYDYEKVKPNTERFGAVKALENPKEAICMEFTDLFIALSRAAGIPAREINGYAYTENPKIQPLSLVADVLHSWPEYWDEEKNTWISIDPTWASTTEGVDYFNKLDLRHFAFVIHGKDSFKPYPAGSYKLGSNPQKDVFVNFGQLPENRVASPDIQAKTQPTFPFSDSKIEVSIFNSGPVAIYNLVPEIYFDGKKAGNDSVEVLPPFANYKMQVKVPFSFLGRNTPNNVKILVDGKQIIIPTNKNLVIVYNLIVIFLILGIILLAVYLRYKKFSLFNFWYKVKQLTIKLRMLILKR